MYEVRYTAAGWNGFSCSTDVLFKTRKEAVLHLEAMRRDSTALHFFIVKHLSPVYR